MPINNPADISGLDLWLDAQDASTIIEVGNNVSRWNDKSSNGKDLVNSNGSPKTNTATIQDNNAVSFDNSNSLYGDTYTALTQPFTTFLVFVIPAIGGTHYVLSHGSTSTTLASLNTGEAQADYGNVDWSATGVLQSGVAHTAVTVGNGVSSSIRVDGVMWKTDTNLGSDPITRDFVGGRDVGDNRGNVLVGEIIRYNKVLTTQEIDDVEVYLADHWASKLPQVVMLPPTGWDYIEMATATVPNDSILSYYNGSHDGADNAAVLTDSTASWDVDELAGLLLKNVTDGSQAVITANTATTITATLAGGTDNDWDANDSYTVQANFEIGDQVAFEETANHSLGSTGKVTLSSLGVPTITGTSDSGTWTFDYKIKDDLGDNSAHYTVSISV
jgi:hypothetical protein